MTGRRPPVQVAPRDRIRNLETMAMPRLPLLLVLGLAACSNPRLNAGISLGADGVSVTPAISAEVGGGTIVYVP